jgi:hypothetical protein
MQRAIPSVLLSTIRNLSFYYYSCFFNLFINGESFIGIGQHVLLIWPSLLPETGLKTITFPLGPSDDLHQLHVGHLHHPVQDLTDPAQDILLQAHW